MPNFLFYRLAKQMISIEAEARSSTLQDIDRGRRTEIDFLNGEIARLAGDVGMEAPVNAWVTQAGAVMGQSHGVRYCRKLEEAGRAANRSVFRNRRRPHASFNKCRPGLRGTVHAPAVPTAQERQCFAATGLEVMRKVVAAGPHHEAALDGHSHVAAAHAFTREPQDVRRWRTRLLARRLTRP